MAILFSSSRLPVGPSQLSDIGSKTLSVEAVPWSKRLFSRKPSETPKPSVHVRRELRVLIVGDSSNDELLILNALHWGGFEIFHRRVETLASVRTALTGNVWDLIVCDYSLRQTTGLAVLTMYHQLGLYVPFIMVSDLGEDFAADVLKAGAHAYVPKQNLAPLVPAVKLELRTAQERQTHRPPAI